MGIHIENPEIDILEQQSSLLIDQSRLMKEIGERMKSLNGMCSMLIKRNEDLEHWQREAIITMQDLVHENHTLISINRKLAHENLSLRTNMKEKNATVSFE